MAGPWFVDPADGLTTNTGLSPDSPWRLIPGQTGASAQTGYGVVAGDTINVKNGTTTALQIVPPAANLTYRGYGVASNVLALTLPSPRNPMFTVTRRVVRELGAHEGMWSIVGCVSSTVIDTSTRSGVVFEDIDIVGNSNQTSRVVSFASSSQNTSGLVLRRFQISSAPQAALSIYAKGCIVEWGRIVDPVGDAILIGASVSNSLKTGTRDVLRFLEIIEPGVGGSVGDAVQTIPSSNQFEGGLAMSDIYLRKTNGVKQAMILSDGTGGISLDRFHFAGSPNSHCQIGVETLKGSIKISNGYVREGGADNALVRFVTSSGVAAGTGSLLQLRNVIHDAQQSAGLFTAASVTLAATADGAVEIDNCVSTAENVQGLSYSGAVSFHPGSLLTWGGNASCKVRNNVLAAGAEPAVLLPTGTANNAAWAVSANCCQGGAFQIGASSYPTVAAFQTAHSAATANIDAQPVLSPEFRPLPSSPLIGAGTHVRYTRDIERQQRPNPPSIGAYDVPRLIRR
jgi:hypothetical protein